MDIAEEKRDTVNSAGFKLLLKDDILPLLDTLRDQLDNLDNSRDSDMNYKGQIYALKQILAVFDKYRN